MTVISCTPNCIQHTGVKVNSICNEIIGDYHCGFDSTGKLLTIYSVPVTLKKKKGITMGQWITCLKTSRKPRIQ